MARLLRMPPGSHDYTLSRERVQMRDGVQLLTDVLVPVGPSSGVVLIRTPYGRDGLIAQLTAGFFASHGYHVVNQSCRGTFGSEGDLDPFRQEVADGADAVAWLRRQPWFTGRFALWGASYAGHAAWAVMVDPPPELVAAVVAISAHDAHWVVHGAGAFSLEDVVSLMDGLSHLEVGAVRGIVRGVTASRRLRPAFEDLPLTRALEAVLPDTAMPYRAWLAATDPDDPVWRDLRLGPALTRVGVPVLLQTGWQDRFPAQVLEQYELLRERGVPVGLTVGPWTHAQTVTKGARTVMTEALDWLAEHLSTTGERRRPSPVRIFVTGAEEWRHLASWPPPTEQRVLHLQPRCGLAETVPRSPDSPSVFTYDPADPTPAVGGRVINPTIGGHRDNRALEDRADVLTFTSAPLAEPLEVIGSPLVELAYETDNPHADFFVRLCEVARDGRSTNLSDGFTRLDDGRTKGSVQVRLDAIAHRFDPGVRIRLQISGGAHPRYARNLGTDEDPSTGTHLAPSRRQVFHGDGGSSRVHLPCHTGPTARPSRPRSTRRSSEHQL